METRYFLVEFEKEAPRLGVVVESEELVKNLPSYSLLAEHLRKGAQIGVFAKHAFVEKAGVVGQYKVL